MEGSKEGRKKCTENEVRKDENNEEINVLS